MKIKHTRHSFRISAFHLLYSSDRQYHVVSYHISLHLPMHSVLCKAQIQFLFQDVCQVTSVLTLFFSTPTVTSAEVTSHQLWMFDPPVRMALSNSRGRTLALDLHLHIEQEGCFTGRVWQCDNQLHLYGKLRDSHYQPLSDLSHLNEDFKLMILHDRFINITEITANLMKTTSY